jgi:DNA-binding MarR family transcriptional regulator
MAEPREQACERIELLLRSVMGGLRGRKRGPEHHHDLDITLGQLHCLRQVNDLGQPTMGDLAERMHLSPSTVTGLVDGLVSRGLVERLEDAEDRRIVRVTPTAAGRRHREQHRRAQQQRLARVFAALSDHDLKRIESALERLNEVVAQATELDDPPASREES